MKNSRKEDIEILEKLISTMKSDRKLFNEKTDKEIYTFFINALEHILSDYKRVLKENEELKEYIAAAPNLDEMTATKYRNIQQDAYIQGRAEEQQKAEQIIYENYIPVQKVKDKVDGLKQKAISYGPFIDKDESFSIESKISVLQELLESEE